MMNNKGTLFVITGPSGAGKGTVLKQVMQSLDQLYFSVSATTRAPREGEVDGVHYHFLTKERFEDMIARGEFLEYDAHMGNFYGTPRKQLEEKLEKGDVIPLRKVCSNTSSVNHTNCCSRHLSHRIGYEISYIGFSIARCSLSITSLTY